MERVPGSIPSTKESRDEYHRRTGDIYSANQENPVRQSRRVRRALKFRPNAEQRRGISHADIAAANVQYELEQRLRESQIRPV